MIPLQSLIPLGALAGYNYQVLILLQKLKSIPHQRSFKRLDNYSSMTGFLVMDTYETSMSADKATIVILCLLPGVNKGKIIYLNSLQGGVHGRSMPQNMSCTL